MIMVMMINRICLFVVIFATALSIANCKPAVSADNQSPAVMCKLPAVRGHCRALLPLWRYDPATGKCHEFKFGGCDGNGNNFMTQKACMAYCSGV